jgi:hypothetical protein
MHTPFSDWRRRMLKNIGDSCNHPGSQGDTPNSRTTQLGKSQPQWLTGMQVLPGKDSSAR